MEHFTTEKCQGCAASDVVYMWREEFGFDGMDLARLLETRPVLDQGGVTYRDESAVAVFARGTLEVPALWSGFFVECGPDSHCAEMTGIGGPGQPTR